MIVFLSIIICIIIFALLYLLVLVRPASRKCADERLICDYAHRGLHGSSVPENSLAAFGKAIEAGYGIELDVQLSRDGEVMVFHDYTLERMTGKKGQLSELCADELMALRLGETEECIPTLSQVLALVDGRVPLLIELKGESVNTQLCPKLAELLKKYSGPYCIESFNPILLGKMASLCPDVYRGILYTNVIRDKKNCSALHIALTLMAMNCIARPDFIAYNEKDRESAVVRLCTGLYGAGRFSWTLCDKTAYEAAKQNGEYAIFESIAP